MFASIANFWGRAMASWPSGKARVCKTLITGSNPVDASIWAGRGPFLFRPLHAVDARRLNEFRNDDHRLSSANPQGTGPSMAVSVRDPARAGPSLPSDSFSLGQITRRKWRFPT